MNAGLARLLVIGLVSGGQVTAAPQISLPQVQGSKEVALPLTQGPYGKHYAFPEIHSWKSLRISLVRTACFGSCPSYKVEIDGDGSVRYDGQICVASKGIRVSHISFDDIRLLYEGFRRADFFSLNDHYNENAVDAPGVGLTLGYDNWGKAVYDQIDTEGLPSEAAKLPDMIDKAAQTARWVGNPDHHCMHK